MSRRSVNEMGFFFVSSAVPVGVFIALAQEARRAVGLHRRTQHLEGFQQQELLPVPLQRCADCHQEEEVGRWDFM